MSLPARSAVCHPDAKHYAGGLCQPCYGALWHRGYRPPSIHDISEIEEEPTCDICGIEAERAKLVQFALRKNVNIGRIHTSRGLGLIRLCERCWRPLAARRGRGKKLRLASLVAALMLIGCSPAATPVPSPSVAVATPTSTAGTPTLPPVAVRLSPGPNPSGVPAATGTPSLAGWFVLGQYAWPPTDDYRFWLGYCEHPPTSLHDAIAFCSTPEEVKTEEAIWMQIDIGMPWPFEKAKPK